MTLSKKIDAALDTLASDALPQELTLDDGAHRLALTITSNGPVGLAFDVLEFSPVAEAPTGTPETLKARADRLVGRVTYLMEPLVLLEHDPIGGEAELRSQAPTARGDFQSYYEVRLRQNGSLRLSRVAFDSETRRRRPIPCQMTREVLERLTDDLKASVG